MLFVRSLARWAVLVLSAVALALVVSCASAPAKPVEPAVTPEPAPVVTPEVVPVVTPEVVPVPTPVPVVEPAPEPTPEPVPEPVVEPTPEPTPVPEPVVEPAPEPVVVPDLPPPPPPLEASEFDEAQQAIADAEAAEADRYSPDLINAARQDLDNAKAKATSDPDGARELLKSAAEKAVQARDASLALRLQNTLDKLAKASELLNALKADKWRADDTKTLEDQRAEAEASLQEDYATGLPKAQAVIEAMTTLLKELTERLGTVQRLQKSVLGALDEADKADAFVWVPDQLQEANDTYFAGTSQFKKFQLDKAEETWTAALFQAQAATAKAIRELARKQTEQLMLDTMRKLEKASGATIVDPQDNIIGPQPWNGTEQLKAIKKPQSAVSGQPVAKIPQEGVVVLGDKQRVTYLDDAKEAWRRGVEAMDDEDYPLANQEFLQAQKLIDAYLALAVEKVYTVRLIPDRRDSLWRISEYDSIFGSPWEWPKIWKRNQKLVQNPDLIYPGWQLIIPPQ